jgi:hypothetical protein
LSATGDFKKIRRRAEDQGWRVEKRKEYWLFFPADHGRPISFRHNAARRCGLRAMLHAVAAMDTRIGRHDLSCRYMPARASCW